METTARKLHITGIVQGVGFRPFIYNLAMESGLIGWVLNASDGVHIHVQGDETDMADFIASIPDRAPRMSRIDDIDVEEVASEDLEGFEIRESDAAESVSTLISPDIATCPACVAELLDPSDRRYHYPFINCTQCGPRFTIIDGLPYDRPKTSMRSFPMCPDCDREYHDPTDRRFHAQPDACFSCGPELFWYENAIFEQATDRETSDAIVERAASYLEKSRILAIKGLGGYHLACDATDQHAVSLLRSRKRRPAKPFACMFPTLESVERICRVDEVERALLTGTARPIVLLRLREHPDPAAPEIAPGVAEGLRELGVMLPYTPLQHLLLAQVARPLVMTSGNLTEEPILADDEEAIAYLGPLTEAILGNDRPILSRYDDSVMRVIDSRVYPVRRARGYAPLPLPIPEAIRTETTVLACGPEQKSTFCYASGEHAFVSQHLGDLGNALAFHAWEDTVALYGRLFDLTPEVLACDMHPSYLSTQWAEERADDKSLPVDHIQHHHAHIAAVCAEHDELGRVIGVALDGTGYGPDHTVWGGEILLCDLIDYERVAHLRAFPLPGGASAVANPCRMALSILLECGLTDHPGAATLKSQMDDREIKVITRVVNRKINSPLTSSAGRLLDAVSALIGICPRASYEGQAAIELEAAMSAEDETEATQRYAFTVTDGVIDPAGAIEAVLDDSVSGDSPDRIARRFHDALANAIVECCVQVSRDSGCDTVALGGGVFMNRYLLGRMRNDLKARGLRVLTGEELPSNDGCISYGQAMIALARLRADEDRRR